MTQIKTLLASSQEGVRIKLRIKAGILALFPVVSSVLRYNGVEVLEADWIELAEWVAYAVAVVAEVHGWLRARKNLNNK